MMNVYRNQYREGGNGWFETSMAAWSNANAQDDPQSLKMIAREIKIGNKTQLINLLKSIENEKNPTP